MLEHFKVDPVLTNFHKSHNDVWRMLNFVTKMEPDRFSYTDVYWVQTTDKHTEKQKHLIENTKKRFESEDSQTIKPNNPDKYI